MTTERPLRVLFVSHSIPPPNQPLSNVGGMQRVALELNRAFGEHEGVAVEELFLHMSWRMMPVMMFAFFARVIFRLPGIIEKRRPDVVLFSNLSIAGPAVIWRKRLEGAGITVAAVAHGLDATESLGIYRWYLKHVIASLDRILCVSRATEAVVQSAGGVSSQTVVVPNGVDLDRFGDRQDGDRARLLEQIGLAADDDTKVLVSVGRHIKRKGFDWFVREVMPRLDANVIFALAGRGPETENIERAIRDRDLGNRVRLLGLVSEDDLGLLYRGADLFVMPNLEVANDMEGFGIVLLEAGASSLPSIAANTEGIRDVVRHGENGLLAASGDINAFVDGITGLLRDDAGHNGLRVGARRAAEELAWPRIVDRYVEALTISR